MDFHNMKRKELQALCKKHGIPANLTNVEMANKLASLLKEKEKPMARSKSCLRRTQEETREDMLNGVNRQSKKVRFSPENETMEFFRSEIKPEEIGRAERARRRSMLRQVAKVGVKCPEAILDNPTRIVKSSVEEVLNEAENAAVETKSMKRGLKSVAFETVSLEDSNLSTRRSSKRREAEKKKKELEADKGLGKIQINTNSRKRGMKIDGKVSESEGASRKKAEKVNDNVILNKSELQKTQGSRLLKSSHLNTENMGLPEDERIVEIEKIVRRSERNSKQIDYTKLNNGLAKVEVAGRGRTKRQRIQLVEDEKVMETASKTGIELHVVLQIEEPSRRSNRFGNRNNSIVRQSEKIKYDESKDEIEKNALVQSTTFEDNARPKRSSPRRKAFAVSDAILAENDTKSKPKNRKRNPVLEEEDIVKEASSLVEDPPRPSNRKIDERRSIMPQAEKTGSDGPKGGNENDTLKSPALEKFAKSRITSSRRKSTTVSDATRAENVRKSKPKYTRRVPVLGEENTLTEKKAVSSKASHIADENSVVEDTSIEGSQGVSATTREVVKAKSPLVTVGSSQAVKRKKFTSRSKERRVKSLDNGDEEAREVTYIYGLEILLNIEPEEEVEVDKIALDCSAKENNFNSDDLAPLESAVEPDTVDDAVSPETSNIVESNVGIEGSFVKESQVVSTRRVAKAKKQLETIGSGEASKSKMFSSRSKEPHAQSSNKGDEETRDVTGNSGSEILSNIEPAAEVDIDMVSQDYAAKEDHYVSDDLSRLESEVEPDSVNVVVSPENTVREEENAVLGDSSLVEKCLQVSMRKASKAQKASGTVGADKTLSTNSPIRSNTQHAQYGKKGDGGVRDVTGISSFKIALKNDTEAEVGKDKLCQDCAANAHNSDMDTDIMKDFESPEAPSQVKQEYSQIDQPDFIAKPVENLELENVLEMGEKNGSQILEREYFQGFIDNSGSSRIVFDTDSQTEAYDDHVLQESKTYDDINLNGYALLEAEPVENEGVFCPDAAYEDKGHAQIDQSDCVAKVENLKLEDLEMDKNNVSERSADSGSIMPHDGVDLKCSYGSEEKHILEPEVVVDYRCEEKSSHSEVNDIGGHDIKESALASDELEFSVGKNQPSVETEVDEEIDYVHGFLRQHKGMNRSEELYEVASKVAKDHPVHISDGEEITPSNVEETIRGVIEIPSSVTEEVKEFRDKVEVESCLTQEGVSAKIENIEIVNEDKESISLDISLLNRITNFKVKMKDKDVLGISALGSELQQFTNSSPIVPMVIDKTVVETLVSSSSAVKDPAVADPTILEHDSSDSDLSPSKTLGHNASTLKEHEHSIVLATPISESNEIISLMMENLDTSPASELGKVHTDLNLQEDPVHSAFPTVDPVEDINKATNESTFVPDHISPLPQEENEDKSSSSFTLFEDFGILKPEEDVFAENLIASQRAHDSIEQSKEQSFEDACSTEPNESKDMEIQFNAEVHTFTEEIETQPFEPTSSQTASAFTEREVNNLYTEEENDRKDVTKEEFLGPIEYKDEDTQVIGSSDTCDEDFTETQCIETQASPCALAYSRSNGSNETEVSPSEFRLLSDDETQEDGMRTFRRSIDLPATDSGFGSKDDRNKDVDTDVIQSCEVCEAEKPESNMFAENLTVSQKAHNWSEESMKPSSQDDCSTELNEGEEMEQELDGDVNTLEKENETQPFDPTSPQENRGLTELQVNDSRIFEASPTQLRLLLKDETQGDGNNLTTIEENNCKAVNKEEFLGPIECKDKDTQVTGHSDICHDCFADTQCIEIRASPCALACSASAFKSIHKTNLFEEKKQGNDSSNIEAFPSELRLLFDGEAQRDGIRTSKSPVALPLLYSGSQSKDDDSSNDGLFRQNNLSEVDENIRTLVTEKEILCPFEYPDVDTEIIRSNEDGEGSKSAHTINLLKQENYGTCEMVSEHGHDDTGNLINCPRAVYNLADENVSKNACSIVGKADIPKDGEDNLVEGEMGVIQITNLTAIGSVEVALELDDSTPITSDQLSNEKGNEGILNASDRLKGVELRFDKNFENDAMEMVQQPFDTKKDDSPCYSDYLVEEDGATSIDNSFEEKERKTQEIAASSMENVVITKTSEFEYSCRSSQKLTKRADGVDVSRNHIRKHNHMDFWVDETKDNTENQSLSQPTQSWSPDAEFGYSQTSPRSNMFSRWELNSVLEGEAAKSTSAVSKCPFIEENELVFVFDKQFGEHRHCLEEQADDDTGLSPEDSLSEGNKSLWGIEDINVFNDFTWPEEGGLENLTSGVASRDVTATEGSDLEKTGDVFAPGKDTADTGGNVTVDETTETCEDAKVSDSVTEERQSGSADRVVGEGSATEDNEKNLGMVNEKGEFSDSETNSSITKMEKESCNFVQVTPNKASATFEMKENVMSVKREILGSVAAKSTVKRCALAELQK